MLELRGEPRIATANPYPPDNRRARAEAGLERLEGIVHNQILPRLLHKHACADAPVLPVEIFARALVEGDDPAASAAFARLSAAVGDDPGQLRELLSSAARRLHDWWRQDVCDFLAVSQAVARLHAMLARLSARDGDDAGAPSMLLLTPPGEAHLFGAEMAAAVFRQEGWRVSRADGDLARLRPGAFEAIGVSCGCARAAARLPEFLARIRALAGSRPPPLVLGGALFADPAARRSHFDADFVASGPESARRISRVLLQPRAV